MSKSGEERLSWEYAQGPVVGDDVPITSEPRDEEAPGVPSSAQRDGDGADAKGGDGADAKGGDGADASEGTELEEREVKADDPQLSPETNQRLTDELREVIGADRVKVPNDRPRASRGEHPQQHGLAAFLDLHRFHLIRNTAIMLTFGAIVSLATNNWWLLPVAAGVHALGTMTVVLTIIRTTTVSEHASPEVAAAVSDEGIHHPDEHFSRMVEEFRREPERGATEVVSPGFNERTREASADPANAAGEQSSAMTPTAEPSRPGGEGGAPDVMIWTTALSLLALSIIFPAVSGNGWLWLLTAVMVPLVAAWLLIQRLMVKRREAHLEGRGPIVVIILCTTGAVAAFCAVVAFAFQH